MNTTPLTPLQKDYIRDYIFDCIRDIAADGEIDTTETIWIDDLAGLGEDCEISVRLNGYCHEVRETYYQPSSLEVCVDYDAEAAFYNGKTYLYSAPVEGRYENTLS